MIFTAVSGELAAGLLFQARYCILTVWTQGLSSLWDLFVCISLKHLGCFACVTGENGLSLPCLRTAL